MPKSWGPRDALDARKVHGAGRKLEGGSTKQVCEHCNQVMGEVIDSCFGYYGDEFEDLGMTDEMPEEVRSLLPRAWGMRHDQHGWVWGEEETT